MGFGNRQNPHQIRQLGTNQLQSSLEDFETSYLKLIWQHYHMSKYVQLYIKYIANAVSEILLNNIKRLAFFLTARNVNYINVVLNFLSGFLFAAQNKNAGEKKYITPLSVPSTMNHGLSRKSTNQQTTVQYTRKYLNNHCSPSFLSFFLSQSPNQFFSLKKGEKKLTLTYLLIVINYRCGIFTFISSVKQCLLYIKKGFSSVKQYRYTYF